MRRLTSVNKYIITRYFLNKRPTHIAHVLLTKLFVNERSNRKPFMNIRLGTYNVPTLSSQFAFRSAIMVRLFGDS